VNGCVVARELFAVMPVCVWALHQHGTRTSLVVRQVAGQVSSLYGRTSLVRRARCVSDLF
jgi:hypothetical protein